MQSILPKNNSSNPDDENFELFHNYFVEALYKRKIHHTFLMGNFKSKLGNEQDPLGQHGCNERN